jgi:hypothetical protein
MRRYRSYREVRSDHHHASSFWTAPSLCADMIFGNDTSSVFLATEVTNEGVEGGREEKAETGHAQHSEQHRRAQRLPHFRACSGRNGERSSGLLTTTCGRAAGAEATASL